MTEQDLIDAVRKGNSGCFAQLIHAYQSPVYNLCYRMLGNASDAEDATQEVFLRVYQNLRRYDTDRAFKTWLLSIASHYCIDRLRQHRWAWQSLEDDDDNERGGYAMRSPCAGPEELALAHERQDQVQSVLNRLSPDDRAMISMLYWQGMSYVEIAEATGTTVYAVKSKLHRMRLSLGRVLGGELGFVDTARTAPRQRVRAAAGCPA